ncbi:unnamed protein product [Polarella glacialis]|uniref:Uncharacterized protein n=1 Tax=Polarella glacialis TaxID=89957 RepID=A0A813KDZ4_POLGL|nr:unnamed protein product [Polarella glacialis]CAE8701716.1 unnamed protein product [Polarella glacialis]
MSSWPVGCSMISLPTTTTSISPATFATTRPGPAVQSGFRRPSCTCPLGQQLFWMTFWWTLCLPWQSWACNFLTVKSTRLSGSALTTWRRLQDKAAVNLRTS